MNKHQVLTGDEAKGAYYRVETRGRCGYFKEHGHYYVFDHRTGAWKESKFDSVDSCKRWIQKGG